MKRLFYVRHSETEVNVAQMLSGTIDTPLTENGRRQTTKIGREKRTRFINPTASAQYNDWLLQP